MRGAFLRTKRMKSLLKCLLAISFFASANTALAACPTPQAACAFFPPFIGMYCPTATAYCVGEDCMMGARGDYILVSASDDPEDVIYDGYTSRWLVRHPGLMANVTCGLLLDHPHGSFVVLPEKLQCSTLFTNGSDVYVELFMSNPFMECNAWLECLCETPPP